MWRRISDLCVIGLCIAFTVFMWQTSHRIAAVEKKLAAAPQGSSTRARPPASENGTVSNIGIVYGSEKAPVTVVQFTDFQCPFCGRFAKETLPVLYAKYIDTGKVRFVVRNLPLSMHSNAMSYAHAAVCADGLTKKNRTFQDALYVPRASAFDSTVAAAALAADVPTTLLLDCIASKRSDKRIQADIAAANELGVSGTPSFVVGLTASKIRGRILRGAYPAEVFIATIDSLLNGKKMASK
jgi:protein-disulfide isomerase